MPASTLTRPTVSYRKTQIQERGREVQRLDKVLRDAGIKLSSVAGDILGRSGRDMLAALVAGTHDPAVLAAMAKGRLRTKLPALREAWSAGSAPTTTGCWSPRSWPTSITWTRPSRCSRRGSSS